MKHILIIDDEPGSPELLKAIFRQTHEVSRASSIEEGMDILSAERIDVVLLDPSMTGNNDVPFLREVKELHPDIPIIIISSTASSRPALEAIRQGAHDLVTRPFDADALRRIVSKAEEGATLQKRVVILEGEMSRVFPVDAMVGTSSAFQAALANARQAAKSDAPVLISGESGAGKELLARFIHATSPRCDEPFVPVHCAALPESLMESELFGHERGAFNHTARKKLGRLDLAAAGTLFFDEVSEIPPATQVKLLRVLQERQFMRVGGTQLIRTSARLVAASAKNLQTEIAAKRFRNDLYHGLNVLPIRLPPLRERPEDVPHLARYFLKYYQERTGATTEDFEPGAMEQLCRYDWPGNVRELRNVVERMLVLHADQRRILPEFLPQEFQNHHRRGANEPNRPKLAEAVSNYERKLIEDALREAQGVQTRAAQLLGTTRRILKYRMEKLEIPNYGSHRAP